MRLLVDSHILLWLDSDPALVPAAQLEALADRTNEVYVSAATSWELGIKQSKGQLALSRPVSEQCMALGFVELPISVAHAELAATLPLHHKDPFDRMLVAQAMLEGLRLVTVDRKLADYGAALLL